MKMIKILNGGLYNLNSLSYINIEFEIVEAEGEIFSEKIFFYTKRNIEGKNICIPKEIEVINFDQIKKIGNEYIDSKYIADTTKKREYLKEITKDLKNKLYSFIAGENKIFCIESELKKVMKFYDDIKKGNSIYIV